MKTTAKYISFYKLFVTAFVAVMVWSCADDPLVKNNELGEGEVQASFAVSFEPSAAALTRATAGDAIKDVEWLAIVIYNESNQLVDVLEYTENDLIPDDIDRTKPGNLPEGYDAADRAESSTPRVTPKVRPTIPIGKYHMYAVANVDQATKDTILNNIQNRISTPAGLKRMVAKWNKNNIASNSQMFGYFTQGTNGSSVGFDAPEVEVSRASTQFHAWVKRCASKVTIVYDGSGLHEDIFVYIHKVTIHDIPKECYLGQENQPTRDIEDEDKNQVWADGESIYYNADGEQLSASPTPEHTFGETPQPATYHKWMRIGRGSGLKGAVDDDGTPHSETATALYFYENAQGNYEDQTPAGGEDTDNPYYKPQIWEKVGHNVKEDPADPFNDFKDNVKSGTYIEVEAYYMSKHAPGISQGKIKYRFMLGQDTKFDYNAFRNCHYKLTLKFRGYANQADWHIEYVEDTPEVYTPDEFYVSYLYNKQHILPIRVVGECESLEVEIIRNDWHPYDPKSPDEVPAASITNSDEKFQWNREVWANTGYENTAEISPNNYNSNRNNRYYGRHKYTYKNNDDTTVICTPPHAGFLALTVPTKYQKTSTELPKLLLSTAGTHWYSSRAGEKNNGTTAPDDNGSATKGKNTMNGLRSYYYGTGGMGNETNDLPQNKRTLDVSMAANKTSKTIGTGRNQCKITKVSDGSKLIEIPLWTRPFSMIYISGFSGNNPYEAYQRKALLRIRAQFTVSGERKVIRKTIPVYQVRRIINPKGVWRSWNDNNTFEVTLMQRRDANTSTFESFKSEGPWKATITTTNGSNFCSLSGGKRVENGSVFGETDDEISFNINFNNSTAEGSSNCAIITVLYHGLTCEHTIFVRQGYREPLEIVSGGGKWSSYSLYAAKGDFGLTGDDNRATGILTVSPLALGTFFKRGNYNEGLITKNNENIGKLEPLNGRSLLLRSVNDAGTDPVDLASKTWAAIEGKPYTNKSGSTNTTDTPRYTWADIKVGNRLYALPTMEQYLTLQRDADVGFGVLYGSGATTVARKFSDAFGYLDPYNSEPTGHKGMRGVIAYNRTNANQVFFPVGFTGVGRRTIQNANNSNEIGILRYGSQSTVLSISAGVWNEHRPISYNLPNNAGAIYWAKNSDANHNLAWDINFADLNFSPYDYGCCWGKYGLLEQGNANKVSKGDAMPIKLVFVKNL